MEYTAQLVWKESCEKQLNEVNNAIITVGNRITLRKNKIISKLQEENAKLLSVKAAVEKKDDKLKESIKDHLNLVEMETSRFKELSSQLVEPQRKNLASKIEQCEKQKEELERELGDVADAISHKKVMLKNLQNQPSSHQETSVSVSRFGAMYSLYYKISNIKWDCTVLNGHMKGFVLKPEEKRVVPFKFDQTSHSQFFITNYLWEQISTSGDFLETTANT